VKNQDFIAKGRRAQRELAHSIGKKVDSQLQGSFEKHLVDLTKCLAPVTVDKDAAKALYDAQVERDVLLAVRGYCDWLAATLYREHLTTGQALSDVVSLPSCDDGALEAIADEYDVGKPILALCVDAIAATSTRLPFVGDISSNQVRVNSTELNQWASHYSW